MRIGVVGLGRIGVMHARHVAELAELVPADGDPARAAAVAGLGVAVRPDMRALLGEVDGVVIATPTPTHPALIREAVRAGVPVLCEKPAALDLGVLRELVQDLKRYDVPVMMGYQRRYDPAYQELRRRVAAGRTGRVQLARSTSNDRTPPDPSFLPGSGGIWRDLLIHDLDALAWVVGERVTEVQAAGAVLVDPVYADHGDADTATATLRFEGGALGVVTGARRNGQGYDCRLEVFGAEATLATGVDDHTPVVSLEPGVPAPAGAHDGFMGRFAAAYRAEIAHFLRVIAGTADNLTPPEEGLHALEIALACERAVRERRPVRVTAD
ncbi:Gfo/Idh/MocA family protein [Actinomadura scrupuli]|uniref:Gfo/Idh/MocA family protein n=1 Tax=Actinomadura scrupuli TaxID=559629 RepID=UPI003D992ADC